MARNIFAMIKNPSAQTPTTPVMRFDYFSNPLELKACL
jgi:hypothetical protein